MLVNFVENKTFLSNDVIVKRSFNPMKEKISKKNLVYSCLNRIGSDRHVISVAMPV